METQKEKILEMLSENINVRKDFICAEGWTIAQKAEAVKEWNLLKDLISDIQTTIK